VVASWALVVGGITMPLCCGLAAWRKPMRNLFPVPVLSLLLGASITAVGLLAGEVA
jgi:predicted exporter